MPLEAAWWVMRSNAERVAWRVERVRDWATATVSLGIFFFFLSLDSFGLDCILSRGWRLWLIYWIVCTTCSMLV